MAHKIWAADSTNKIPTEHLDLDPRNIGLFNIDVSRCISTDPATVQDPEKTFWGKKMIFAAILDLYVG